jgi:DNA (cytosine-5)-methyltransferase 1
MNITTVQMEQSDKIFTIASLFAGIGGIDLGFIKSGFNVAWANEIDEKACLTYRQNFSHPIICDDIKNLETKSLKKVDVLTAGFPCQAFSIAGYRQGFKDDRGSIFFDLMRVVASVKPPVLFLENVKNLVSHHQGRTFDYIRTYIEKLGYKIKYQVMNTCEYSNIPQNRERVYIICFLHQQHFDNFHFPKKVEAEKRLSTVELIDDVAEDSYYYNHTKYYDTLKKAMVNKNTCYQWRRQYVRENKSNMCPTLTANMGTGGHNVPLIIDSKDIRKLTPRECARFQGFDDTFKLPDNLPKSSLYKQFGNSVSVPVIQAIASKIHQSLAS